MRVPVRCSLPTGRAPISRFPWVRWSNPLRHWHTPKHTIFYFLQLAEAVSPENVSSVANSFDLDAPAKDATAANLIGLGDEWKIAPLRLARAYLELFRRKDAPGVSDILEGLRQSGIRGTGAAVDRQLKHSAALIKTGTAPCTHSRWAPADGLVMALVPAEKPELLLFIRMHSVTGAKAAETAGLMLRDVEQ